MVHIPRSVSTAAAVAGAIAALDSASAIRQPGDVAAGAKTEAAVSGEENSPCGGEVQGLFRDAKTPDKILELAKSDNKVWTEIDKYNKGKELTISKYREEIAKLETVANEAAENAENAVWPDIGSEAQELFTDICKAAFNGQGCEAARCGLPKEGGDLRIGVNNYEEFIKGQKDNEKITIPEKSVTQELLQEQCNDLTKALNTGSSQTD